MNLRIFFTPLISIFFCLWADPAPAGEVLDFEAEVIEGEKKAPDVLLQMDTDASELSAVLYDRRNFNDFHQTDRNYRPRLNEVNRIQKSTSPQRKPK